MLRRSKIGWCDCSGADLNFVFGKQDSGLRPGVPLLLDGREVKEWPRARNLDKTAVLR